MFPLLEVLFKTSKTLSHKPIYTGIANVTSYVKESLFYHISNLNNEHGPQYALLLAVGLVITTFLFKNLFNTCTSQMVSANKKVKNSAVKKKYILLPVTSSIMLLLAKQSA